jgi:hypothetical protein
MAQQFFKKYASLFAGDSTMYAAAVTDIIYSPRRYYKNQRIAYRFLHRFPRDYYLFDDRVLKDKRTARAIIKESGGYSFSSLPLEVRSDEKLAAFAFQLCPIIGYSIPYMVRRRICTPDLVDMICRFPTDRLTSCVTKYLPRAAFREYAQRKLKEREAFIQVFMQWGLPAVLNHLVAEYADIAMEREPIDDTCGPAIYWIRTLRRGAC